MKRGNPVKRIGSSALIVSAMAVVVMFSAIPSQAYTPKNQDLGYVTCIDSIDPEVACFGASVLVSPAPTDPNYLCVQLKNRCIVDCINQEMAGLTKCSNISDPVASGNCSAIVETTVQGCLANCPYCP